MDKDVKIAQLEAQQMILKQLVGHMMARMAAEYEDPENFIMTMTAPTFEAAASLDAGDETSRALAQALDAFAQSIESAALGLVQ